MEEQKITFETSKIALEKGFPVLSKIQDKVIIKNFLKELVKENSNDADLGAAIRKIISE